MYIKHIEQIYAIGQYYVMARLKLRYNAIRNWLHTAHTYTAHQLSPDNFQPKKREERKTGKEIRRVANECEAKRRRWVDRTKAKSK